MALLSLGMVVLLILGAARVARLLPTLRQAAPPGEIALRGTMTLDGRRRLYLIEARGQHALVLTGGTTDVVLALPPAC